MRNKHLDHIEDKVFIGEGDEVIALMSAIVDDFSGASINTVTVTEKWDGAPSIFAGIDPSDGKFFVAPKSILRKDPLVYKSLDDIKKDVNQSRRKKFEIAFAELSKLDIKGVIQGDFLFTEEDVKETTIDETQCVTFHPNTIVYAVRKHSHLASKILSARIGVVWHTRYRGASFQTMSGRADPKIANSLRIRSSVWSVEPKYLDVSNTVCFTKAQADILRKTLANAKDSLNRVDAKAYALFNKSKSELDQIHAALNESIRTGSAQSADRLVIAISDRLIKHYRLQGSTVATPAAKQRWQNAEDDLAKFIAQYADDLAEMLSARMFISMAKMEVLNKLNTREFKKSFLLRRDGTFIPTAPEGFVAMNNSGDMVKLVDRLTFSKANFSDEFVKGWV